MTVIRIIDSNAGYVHVADMATNLLGENAVLLSEFLRLEKKVTSNKEAIHSPIWVRILPCHILTPAARVSDQVRTAKEEYFGFNHL